jgi:hypothetical protein
MLAPLISDVPVYGPDNDGSKHLLSVLTTYISKGYGLTIKEKRSFNHMTWLYVGEPCDFIIISIDI